MLEGDSGAERDVWEPLYVHCSGILDPQTKSFGSGKQDSYSSVE